MKILLFGKNGMVARRLYTLLLPLGDVTVLGSTDVDFCDLAALKKAIQDNSPDIIINAAAYTFVDKAESEQERAFTINAEAVKIIAQETKKLKAWLVHYSTDYVFDGTKQEPYTEQEPPNPINIYGESKAKADDYIQHSGCQYLILRPSWVFDSYGHNFAKTILNLAKKNTSLRIVNDQRGAPTSALFIAEITLLFLYKIMSSTQQPDDFCGIYHITPSGSTSWYEFARALITRAQELGVYLSCPLENMIPISTQEYPLPAKRPIYSVLATQKWHETFGLVLPHWSQYVPIVVDELKAMAFI